MLGAVSVATACLIPGSPAAQFADVPAGASKLLGIEHASGATLIEARVNDAGAIEPAAVVRTAHKLFDGVVYTN